MFIVFNASSPLSREWLVQEGDYVEKDQAIASEVDEDGALFGRIDKYKKSLLMPISSYFHQISVLFRN